MSASASTRPSRRGRRWPLPATHPSRSTRSRSVDLVLSSPWPPLINIRSFRIQTVAAYGREKQVVEQFDRLQQPNVKAHRNALGLGSIFFGLGQASFPLLVVLVFSYGGDKFAKGQISITNLFAVFEMSFIGAFAVGKAFGFIGDISRSFHSFRVFSKWIERLPLVARLDSVIKTRPLHSPSEKVGGADIIFSKVQLVYPTRPERPAIHELDLHIKAGEKVAFCGPSGGGKSAVLALLARFYESSRGVITVDGEDIRAAELVDHYERISLVSQDAVLYEGTVRLSLRPFAHLQALTRLVLFLLFRWRST